LFVGFFSSGYTFNQEVSLLVQKTRDVYFDNAKFLLMVLVVFGHFLQPFISDQPIYKDLYYFIFIFHMPAFILIAGYFSKNIGKQGSLKKIVKKLILPYLFFQFVYSVYYYLIGLQSSFNWDFLVPQWSLWFLISLSLWQLSLYFFRKITPFLSIFLSISISLLAGYLPFFDQLLTLQRTLTFLPFFIAGYYLSSQQIDWFKHSSFKYWSVLFLSVVYLFLHYDQIMNKYWVFGSQPYEDFLMVPEFGAAIRCLILFLSILGITGFLGIVPDREMFFSKWGKNTMVVYLMQGFFVKGVRALGIDELSLSLLGFVILFAGSLFLTILLASEPFQRVKTWMRERAEEAKQRFTEPDRS
jgi:fucose 4-O-acetylase-like acetyltransferase